jgi:hypothetical protein
MTREDPLRYFGSVTPCRTGSVGLRVHKVLPTKLVVRVMQIYRRLSLLHQIEFAARIPLSH